MSELTIEHLAEAYGDSRVVENLKTSLLMLYSRLAVCETGSRECENDDFSHFHRIFLEPSMRY